MVLNRVFQEFLSFCDIFPSLSSPQAQPYCIVTFCFSDSPSLIVGQEHHPCSQKTVHCIIWRWKRKDSSVTRQADLKAVKQIMPAQTVCSENHCEVAGDEWVVFMASGSFARERVNWKMILAVMVGKSDRSQISLPTSLLAWGMMAGLGLDLWDVQYKDEKNHLLYSISLFEMKIWPSRTRFF